MIGDPLPVYSSASACLGCPQRENRTSPTAKHSRDSLQIYTEGEGDDLTEEEYYGTALDPHPGLHEREESNEDHVSWHDGELIVSRG